MFFHVRLYKNRGESTLRRSPVKQKRLMKDNDVHNNWTLGLIFLTVFSGYEEQCERENIV